MTESKKVRLLKMKEIKSYYRERITYFEYFQFVCESTSVIC